MNADHKTLILSHIWTIKNAAFLFSKNSASDVSLRQRRVPSLIYSSSFFQPNEKLNFSLRLAPPTPHLCQESKENIADFEKDQFLSIYLHLEDSPSAGTQQLLDIEYEISLVAAGEILKATHKDRKIFSSDACHGFDRFLSANEMFSSSENGYLVDGKLSFHCQITIHNFDSLSFKPQTNVIELVPTHMSEFDANLDVIQFSHCWPVEEFRNYFHPSFQQEFNMPQIESPYFPSPTDNQEDEKMTFKFILDFNRDESNTGLHDYISLYLEANINDDNEPNRGNINVCYQIALLNPITKKPQVLGVGYEPIKSGETFCKGSPRFILKSELLDPRKRLLPKNMLLICAKIEIHVGIFGMALEQKLATFLDCLHIVCEHRDAWVSTLKEALTSQNRISLLFSQKLDASLAALICSLIEKEFIAHRVETSPSNPMLKDKMLEYICDALLATKSLDREEEAQIWKLLLTCLNRHLSQMQKISLILARLLPKLSEELHSADSSEPNWTKHRFIWKCIDEQIKLTHQRNSPDTTESEEALLNYLAALLKYCNNIELWKMALDMLKNLLPNLTATVSQPLLIALFSSAEQINDWEKHQAICDFIKYHFRFHQQSTEGSISQNPEQQLMLKYLEKVLSLYCSNVHWLGPILDVLLWIQPHKLEPHFEQLFKQMQIDLRLQFDKNLQQQQNLSAHKLMCNFIHLELYYQQKLSRRQEEPMLDYLVQLLCALLQDDSSDDMNAEIFEIGVNALACVSPNKAERSLEQLVAGLTQEVANQERKQQKPKWAWHKIVCALIGRHLHKYSSLLSEHHRVLLLEYFRYLICNNSNNAICSDQQTWLIAITSLESGAPDQIPAILMELIPKIELEFSRSGTSSSHFVPSWERHYKVCGLILQQINSSRISEEQREVMFQYLVKLLAQCTSIQTCKISVDALLLAGQKRIQSALMHLIPVRESELDGFQFLPNHRQAWKIHETICRLILWEFSFYSETLLEEQKEAMRRYFRKSHLPEEQISSVIDLDPEVEATLKQVAVIFEKRPYYRRSDLLFEG